ncbi:MAG TPA: hypothetical protein VGG79_01375, partial [Roseiarcus sp.]
HFSALLGAQPTNARKPDGKFIGLHRIKLLSPDPSLTQINRYRYKRQIVGANRRRQLPICHSAASIRSSAPKMTR